MMVRAFGIGLSIWITFSVVGTTRAQTPDEPPKRIKLDSQTRTWPELLRWLEREAGWRLYDSQEVPYGTFAFDLPPGSDAQTFTLNETVDKLNLGLSKTGFVLEAADADYPWVLLRGQALPTKPLAGAKPENLAKLPQEEKVWLMLRLRNGKAVDFAPNVWKLISPDGVVVPRKTGGEIFVCDKVSKLRELVATLEKDKLLAYEERSTIEFTGQNIAPSRAKELVEQVFKMHNYSYQDLSIPPLPGSPPLSENDNLHWRVSIAPPLIQLKEKVVHIAGTVDELAVAKLLIKALETPLPNVPEVADGEKSIYAVWSSAYGKDLILDKEAFLQATGIDCFPGILLDCGPNFFVTYAPPSAQILILRFRPLCAD